MEHDNYTMCDCPDEKCIMAPTSRLVFFFSWTLLDTLSFFRMFYSDWKKSETRCWNIFEKTFWVYNFCKGILGGHTTLLCDSLKFSTILIKLPVVFAEALMDYLVFSSESPTHWSSCSLENLALGFEHGIDYCLRNKPKRWSNVRILSIIYIKLLSLNKIPQRVNVYWVVYDRAMKFVYTDIWKLQVIDATLPFLLQ